MESEVSMTLGYVLKCNYRLPYNASDSTDDSYVRFTRATRPDYLNENLPSASQETGILLFFTVENEGDEFFNIGCQNAKKFSSNFSIF